MSQPTEATSNLALDVGEIVVSRTPSSLRTVLGSCVVVCLYDPLTHTGGASHFLLPSGLVEPGAGHRFGEEALPTLVDAMVAAGSLHTRLQAKVFGAAAVIRHRGILPTVPAANALCALAFCARAGIPVVAQRLGGRQPLEIVFETHTGRVRVRPLAN